MLEGEHCEALRAQPAGVGRVSTLSARVAMPGPDFKQDGELGVHCLIWVRCALVDITPLMRISKWGRFTPATLQVARLFEQLAVAGLGGRAFLL